MGENIDFSSQLNLFFERWKEIERQHQAELDALPFEEKLGQFFKEWRKVFINDKK